MGLEDPRRGQEIGFHIYSAISEESTLGDPEKIVWSSINQLCSVEVAEGVIESMHGIRKKTDIETIAKNLKVYIRQANELYDAAKSAKANTAPLFYYYSFLNLAKGLCEIKYPKLHERAECYRHGLSWNPNRSFLVNMKTEQVNLTARGVWHLLWEFLSREKCLATNPTPLKLRDLFPYCPEITVEYERTYGKNQRFVDLEKPNVLYDEALDDIWIRFSIYRDDFKINRISAPKFLSLIQTNRTGYKEVKSKDSEYRTFESVLPLKFNEEDVLLNVINPDIRAFNSFVYWGHAGLEYSVPLQVHLPIRLHQIMVLYTIIFWLGSLVRYDPHSVNYLMDSRYWILLDGFMNQSRFLLLELFEWAFYQTETTLRLSR